MLGNLHTDEETGVIVRGLGYIIVYDTTLCMFN